MLWGTLREGKEESRKGCIGSLTIFLISVSTACAIISLQPGKDENNSDIVPIASPIPFVVAIVTYPWEYSVKQLV